MTKYIIMYVVENAFLEAFFIIISKADTYVVDILTMLVHSYWD